MTIHVRVIIDRFEDDQALLFVGDAATTSAWPRNLLPPEAREGDVLSVCLTVDPEATGQLRREAEDLLDKLTKKEG